MSWTYNKWILKALFIYAYYCISNDHHASVMYSCQSASMAYLLWRIHCTFSPKWRQCQHKLWKIWAFVRLGNGKTINFLWLLPTFVVMSSLVKASKPMINIFPAGKPSSILWQHIEKKKLFQGYSFSSFKFPNGEEHQLIKTFFSVSTFLFVIFLLENSEKTWTDYFSFK